ncbi:hypothetical protein LTR66_010569, partial [Elasticomyces elasticus]
MSSSFERSVKGATKIKLAAPKSKYVEHILLATRSDEAGVAEVFRTLQTRLRDSTWTIVFKALLIVHLMIKEGETDVTLKYLAASPKNRLAIDAFTDVQTQGQNIRRYSDYLRQRAISYAQTKTDHVRSGEGRMKGLSVDKGLLRETENVQGQIKALVKCDLLANEPENEISLMAFRLLIKDLLVLYTVMNEAVMNILSHFFEMSKPDAERAVSIYKTFAKLTDLVMQYLSTARHHETSTRVEIPKIKHAPTSLASSLQEYVRDKDFEVNRRQYLAEQESKRNGKGSSIMSAQPIASKSAQSKPAQPKVTAESFPQIKQAQPMQAQQPANGPAPDLIDFFDSIEQNQQPMLQGHPQYQNPTTYGNPPNSFGQGYQTQPFNQPADAFTMGAVSTNPFGQPQAQPQQQLQPNFTGMGFGGYGPQPQQQFMPQGPALSNVLQPPSQQNTVTFPMQQFPDAEQQRPQSTNPFRQSSMSASPVTSSPTGAQGIQRQSTNPFAKHVPQQQNTAMTGSPFTTSPPPQPQYQQQQ